MPSTEKVVQNSKEVKIIMEGNDDGTFKATVTTVTSENGKEVTTEQDFHGTEEEVKASIDALKEKGINAKVMVEKIIEDNDSDE